MKGFPREIAKAYRCTIANSTTTMAYLDHLAANNDASEEDLIELVQSTVTKRKPRGSHVRDVLFALANADLLTVEHKRVCLTRLGRQVYDHIQKRDSNPIVTLEEVKAYRSILKSHDVRVPILKALSNGARLSQQQVLDLVKAGFRGTQEIWLDSAVDDLLVTLGSTKLIRLEGELYSLTELGAQICEDLSINS
jgi:hypothetical protein